MGGNLKELKNEARNYHDAINHWKYFIEVIFRADSYKSKDEFHHKNVDEHVIDDFVSFISCKKVKHSYYERDNYGDGAD